MKSCSSYDQLKELKLKMLTPSRMQTDRDRRHTDGHLLSITVQIVWLNIPIKRAMMALNAHLSITAFREPDLELIKANILTKIHNDYINK